ncbi:hypothetical protein AB0O76_37050 [Streptomyces sp. NPDC086554]|uniref:hypothetical protein n=1 Tax=Streptomyces sp. NPDC086554 TaxID=3154864 RepID=UPI0034271BD9
MGIEFSSEVSQGLGQPKEILEREESTEGTPLEPKRNALKRIRIEPVESKLYQARRAGVERRLWPVTETDQGSPETFNGAFEGLTDRALDKLVREYRPRRYHIAWYANETKVMDKVTRRLRGVTSLEEARAATRDLAIVIHEFGPSDRLPETVTILGCPLKEGEPSEELSLKVDALPPRLEVFPTRPGDLSRWTAAAATPTISAIRGEYEDAALQAASAMLAQQDSWEAKVLRFVTEGMLWFLVPTKPITAAVQLLTDAVRRDEAPQAWWDLAQGQFVGQMCHLAPLPVILG